MTIKKVINTGLFLTCLVMCLSGCGKTDRTSDTAERSVIKLGSDSYPPYNYLNEDGVPTGIDVELATEAFGRMGYDVEIVNIDWEKKQELVENGDIDCIMGCFSMKGRLDDYKWAGPYRYERNQNEAHPHQYLQVCAADLCRFRGTGAHRVLYLHRL